MPVFTPNLTTLPPPQRKLWPELASTPEGFTLYGGTALALRLAHRTSVDFDFFSNAPFDPDDLARMLPYLKDAERVRMAPNTLTCRVDRGGPVLLSFFGELGLGASGGTRRGARDAAACGFAPRYCGHQGGGRAKARRGQRLSRYGRVVTARDRSANRACRRNSYIWAQLQSNDYAQGTQLFR